MYGARLSPISCNNVATIISSSAPSFSALVADCKECSSLVTWYPSTELSKFFNDSKILPVDKFVENVLYSKKIGYYSSKIPFGKSGDFLTAPGISNLFSEIIGIWLVTTWSTLGRPKKFNIVELGPGDGSLTKILLKTFQQFPLFYKAANIFLYEKSNLLKNLQKKNIDSLKVKWIRNFSNIKKGPVVFFGNEFFGISNEVKQKADELVKLPMYGFTESFNISVSVALCLYELTQKLHKSELYWRFSSEKMKEKSKRR